MLDWLRMLAARIVAHKAMKGLARLESEMRQAQAWQNARNN